MITTVTQVCQPESKDTSVRHVSYTLGQPSGGFIWCHMCCWRRPGGMPGDEDGLVTKHVKYYSRMSESDSNIELSQVNIQTAEHFRAEKNWPPFFEEKSTFTKFAQNLQFAFKKV